MSDWIKFSFSGIIGVAITLVGISSTMGLLFYGLKKLYGSKEFLKNRQATNNNIIPIIHNISLLNITDNSITISTHMDFVKAYEKMDKKKDIHIIMHTTGGSLSSASHMQLHNKSSKYTWYTSTVYIPYYAYFRMYDFLA
jgi:hypothetical protein